MPPADVQAVKDGAELLDVWIDRALDADAGWDRVQEYAPSLDADVRLLRRVPLPHALFEQYAYLECRTFMGLFPQIHRAWFSVDNRFFLWNYADGSDFYAFDGVEQVITAAALVAPRGGIFVDEVKYLLALSTPVEVVLLGVCFAGGTTAGEVTLVPAQMVVSTDNVAMLKMVGAPDGRLFGAGRDGCLYELVYGNAGGGGGGGGGVLASWLSLPGAGPDARKLRRLNHSRVGWGSVVPAAVQLLLRGEDPLLDVAVDHSRYRLYTLSERGVLTVYDVRTPSRASKLASADVAYDSRRRWNGGGGGGASGGAVSERSFLSLFVVPPSMSQSTELILVTSFGERLYYKLRSSRTSAKSLRAVGWRGSPPVRSDTERSSRGRPLVHTAGWIRGALVLADARALADAGGDGGVGRAMVEAAPVGQPTRDVLVCVFPERTAASDAGSAASSSRGWAAGAIVSSPYRALDQPAMAPPVEVVSETVLDAAGGSAKAWDIAEAPDRGITAAELGGGAKRSEPMSEFIVLTNAAIHLYARLSPEHQMRQMLAAAASDAAELYECFRRLGAAKACALCIGVAISPFDAFRGSKGVTSSAVASNLEARATQAIFALGGEPEVAEYDEDAYADGAAQLPPWAPPSALRRPRFDVGRPTSSLPHMRFSGAHDGLCVFVAQTLAPLWRAYLTSSRTPGDYQLLQLDQATMLGAREKLLAVVDYVERNATTFARSDVDSRGDEWDAAGKDVGDDGRPPPASIQTRLYRRLFSRTRVEEARRADHASVRNVLAVCDRTAQALALLNLLGDHHFPRLAAKLSAGMAQTLASVRVNELVTRESGAALCSALVEALFSWYADEPGVVDALRSALLERSPLFFGRDDVVLHRGLSLLRELQRASSARENAGSGGDAARAQVDSLAAEAVRELKPVISRVVDLEDACEKLRGADALPQVAELALAAATEAEERGGQPARFDTACACVFDALAELLQQQPSSAAALGATMRTLMASGGAEFSQRLYAFLIDDASGGADGGAEELLKWPSARVERYLAEHDLNLLWRYYARHDRHAEAAGVLVAMADDAAQRHTLAQRVNYLASALHNVAVATAGGDARAATAHGEIRDRLDVARVQLRLVSELRRRFGAHPGAQPALEELQRELLELSTLYNSYAQPWDLFESQLDCLRCASYRDDRLVRSLWRALVDEELRLPGVTPAVLMARLEGLAREFCDAANVFPVEFLVALLERRVYARRRAGHVWRDAAGDVASTLHAVGVPRLRLLTAYVNLLESAAADGSAGGDEPVGDRADETLGDDEFQRGDSDGDDDDAVWSREAGASLHLAGAVVALLTRWLGAAGAAPGRGGKWANGHDADTDAQNAAAVDRVELLAGRSEIHHALAVFKGRLRMLASTAAARAVAKLESLEKTINTYL